MHLQFVHIKVYSIVSHHGSTATSGRYVADVLKLDQEFGGRWFRFEVQSKLNYSYYSFYRFDDDCATLEKVLSGSGSNCHLLQWIHHDLRTNFTS